MKGLCALALLLALAAPAAGQALEDAELDRRLAARTIDLPASPRPIPELIARIERVLGADIHLSRSARNKLHEDPRGTLTLPLTGARLRDAIELLLAMTELTYVRRRGRLVLTTWDDMRWTLERPVTRVYRIADLTAGWIDPFPTGLPGLGGLRGRLASPRVRDAPSSADRMGHNDIVELIKSSVDPNSWEEGPYSIDAVGGRLVVVASEASQRKIGPLLAALRSRRLQRVQVDVWAVPASLPAARGPALPLADWLRIARQAGSRRMTVMGPMLYQLQLHQGPIARLAGAGGPVRMPVGRTLIVTTAPAPGGATGVELQYQDSALPDADGRSPLLRRMRVGLSVDLPPGQAVPVFMAGRGDAGQALVLAARRTALARGDVAPDPVDPRPAEVVRRLRALRRDWRFESAPLPSLAVELSGLLKQSVVVWPSVRDVRVDLQLRDASAEELLAHLRRELGIGWTVRHGALLLVRAENAGPAAVTVTRDLRDIRYGAYLDPSRRWARNDGGAPAWVEQFDDEEEGQLTIDALMNVIRDNIAKDSWEGENTIKVRGGVYIIRNAPSVIREIDTFIAGLRAGARRALNVELVARRGPRELARVRLRTIDGAEAAWRDGVQRYDPEQDVVRSRDLRVAARPTLISGEARVRLKVQFVLPGPQPLRWAAELELPLGRETLVGGAPRDGVTLYATVSRVPDR